MSGQRITYSFVGGTNKMQFPNIQGSALSRNMFTDRNGDNVFMQSVPGIKYLDTLGIDKNTHCDGLYVPSTGLQSTGYARCLFVAYQGKIYRIDAGMRKEIIGSYAIGNTVNFAESGGERAILLWVDGTSIYGYDLKNGEAVSITLPKRITDNVYIKPSHIAVVSGSIVLNDVDSGYVYYSVPYPLSQEKRNVFKIINGQVQYDTDNITVLKDEVDSGVYCFLDDYGVAQYFNAESSSDKCVAIYSVGSLLTLYGPTSIEFWQRGDAEAFQTWQRVSYTINKEQGLEAPYSLASVNHTQFCIGTGKSSSRCILAITDTKVEKISPLWLDKILNEQTNVQSVIGWTYSLNNHSFYLFSIGPECYVYDFTTKEWHIRSSRNYYNGKLKNYMPLFAAWWENKIVVGCSENGNIMTLDPDYFYEDFNANDKLPLLRVRQTPVITTDYKPFMIFELALECNTGAIENYGNPGKCLIQKSDDGGYTFGNIRETSVGKKGEYFKRCRWMNLGMTRNCVLKVTYNEPTDFVITDASIRFQTLSTGV